ncbi:MAG: YjbH domain-containing protein [candidate division Zixibacteria bacterium]|nr:YjbH domain-containing protein [candidate division Zixibacteria bacterium]
MKSNLKSILFITVITLLISSSAFCQEDETESYFGLQPRLLIDAPTAWTLPRGCFDLSLRVLPGGGIIGGTNIGLSGRFMLGISYGADAIISNTSANWNPNIEFNVKLRLIDEAYYLPAIAVGFVSQGYGSYSDEHKRYAYKSKGFYAVATRSLYLYNLSLGGHFGVNFTMEDNDGDNEPSLFFGIDTQFNNDVAIVAEYDLALNDDRGDFYGRGRGYLNLSIKWLYSENLELEAVFKNLLNNRVGIDSFSRGLRFTYVEYF